MENIELNYKTILYNFVFCVLWSVLFFTNYNMDKIVFYLDVITMGMFYVPEFYLGIICIIICYNFIKYAFRFYLSIRNHIRTNNLIQMFSKGFVFAFEGAQDTGKTFTTVFLAYMISQYKWYRLRKDYYRFKNIENELKKKKGKIDRITYQIYKAKETAYLYFKSNEKKYIPCLISNNTVYEKKTKRESYPFDIKLLQMLKRVPESCVFILDEVAEDLPNTMRLSDTEKVKGKTNEQIDSEKNAKAINSFLSMARQFADATLFINDQRLMEVFIGVRSVCQIRRSLKEKSEVLKPKAVRKIMNYAEKHINAPTGKVKYVKLFERFERIYKSIGYLKVVYVEQYGYDETFKNERNEYVMYLPQNVPIIYHHRGRYVDYKAKNLKIDLLSK